MKFTWQEIANAVDPDTIAMFDNDNERLKYISTLLDCMTEGLRARFNYMGMTWDETGVTLRDDGYMGRLWTNDTFTMHATPQVRLDNVDRQCHYIDVWYDHDDAAREAAVKEGGFDPWVAYGLSGDDDVDYNSSYVTIVTEAIRKLMEE